MISGIGVDNVDISRLEQHLAKTPRLLDRLFTAAEKELPMRSLAGRFAAKEALVKAFGDSHGISYKDIEVVKTNGSKPVFSETEALGDKLNKLGLKKPHLSITHDGNIATAFVVLEFCERNT